MGTAEPLPANIIDLNLATMVLLLGIFFIIVGIVIAGVVYRESREWKKMILPMFDRDSAEIAPESSKEPNGLTPRMASFGKEIFSRVFNHMDVAGLLGGAATVVMGIIVIFISLYIGQ
jgi:predicted transporter